MLVNTYQRDFHIHKLRYSNIYLHKFIVCKRSKPLKVYSVSYAYPLVDSEQSAFLEESMQC